MTTRSSLSRAQTVQLPEGDRAMLREMLTRQLDALEAQAREHEQTGVELTGQHDVESLLERELAHDLAARSRMAAADIVQALARLDDGHYGICEGCGSPIPVERLEVIPQARTCVSCPAP
jgi:DnaK suppressor protein